MSKCKNCGHEISIDKQYGNTHKKLSNYAFPHFDCTTECMENKEIDVGSRNKVLMIKSTKKCGCTNPEPEVKK